jgi:YD repeat-containing protein
LNRLISASTTGPEWGQSFSYDGFGNMLAQTVTKGQAPTLSLSTDFGRAGNTGLSSAVCVEIRLLMIIT